MELLELGCNRHLEYSNDFELQIPECSLWLEDFISCFLYSHELKPESRLLMAEFHPRFNGVLPY